MISSLLLGLPVMLLGLFLQLMLLLAALHYYRRHHRLVESPSFADGTVVLGGVMVLLTAGNLGQITLWAGLFLYLGEFATFPEAFYHSAVNFSTLGYGDIVMSEHRRLLGPLESLNGILMIGISSSVLVTTFQDAIRKTVAARRRDD
jgi:hypothetical protein